MKNCSKSLKAQVAAEIRSLEKDGYSVEVVTKSRNVMEWKLTHRNGNELNVVWQDAPIERVEILKNGRVVNFWYA